MLFRLPAVVISVIISVCGRRTAPFSFRSFVENQYTLLNVLMICLSMAFSAGAVYYSDPRAGKSSWELD
jgi:hypothetical protein